MKNKSLILLIIALILGINAYSQNTFAQINTVSASPYIPQSVEWGGEKIELDRYDMRERFDREMISFCYGHTNIQ